MKLRHCSTMCAVMPHILKKLISCRSCFIKNKHEQQAYLCLLSNYSVVGVNKLNINTINKSIRVYMTPSELSDVSQILDEITLIHLDLPIVAKTSFTQRFIEVH